MTGKEISKWADDFMFTAEPSNASDGPSAYLLGGPADPLGQVVACINMYKGKVVRDLADVTDEERRNALEQIQKTVLAMPLEAVSLHFMIEGVHRGITHQMVRQRTAAFAQESTRFAVKEDLADATALPPSLEGTRARDELLRGIRAEYKELGLAHELEDISDEQLLEANISGLSMSQQHRLTWDEAVAGLSTAYNGLVNDGMPAEEARGLMPTNITTRLNYITNLRSFYDTMSKRVGDQAQFEWRRLIAVMVNAMIEYGATQQYQTRMSKEEFDEYDGDYEYGSYDAGTGDVLIGRSSTWQYKAIAEQIKPEEFRLGRRAFGADFDRPSRIGERVDAFAAMGIPSDQWTKGSQAYNIPPINPAEWLLDPDSARLNSDLEFDIYGRRVKKGTALHWHRNEGSRPGIIDPDGNMYDLGPTPDDDIIPR